MRAKTINEEIKEKKNTIAIDFDGVIHSYTQGWTGDVPEDPPMKGVEKALKSLKDKGWLLKILSTRKAKYIEKWLEEHELDKYIESVHNTKIPAKIYIDDKGYRFENWNDTIDFVNNFKEDN